MSYNFDKPLMIERIVASLSYISAGTIGFIWLILGLITNAKIRTFMQYHIFQSIFLSIAYALLYMIFKFLISILILIPFINVVTLQITFYLNAPILWHYSLIQTVVFSIVIYLAITSFMGKYTKIPYVSDIINQNIGRY